MIDQKIITIQGLTLEKFLDKIDERTQRSFKQLLNDTKHLEKKKRQKDELDPDAFLTKKECAKLMRVTIQTITSRMRKGSLKYVKFGRRVLFRKEYIKNILDDGGFE